MLYLVNIDAFVAQGASILGRLKINALTATLAPTRRACDLGHDNMLSHLADDLSLSILCTLTSQ